MLRHDPEQTRHDHVVTPSTDPGRHPDARPPLRNRLGLTEVQRDSPDALHGTLEPIAGHARRFYDLTFDPETEVLVTSGATEALTASIMGLVGQGYVWPLTRSSMRPVPGPISCAGAMSPRMATARRS